VIHHDNKTKSSESLIFNILYIESVKCLFVIPNKENPCERESVILVWKKGEVVWFVDLKTRRENSTPRK
jgi:hypothetical protein